MDSVDDRKQKLEELEELRERVTSLERELAEPPPHWQASEYYTAYYATTGFMLGIFGAVTSLLFNVVGSLIVGQHPLKLIQIYLTFPLGAEAKGMDTGIALAIGCCLYLATGMLLGIPFQMAFERFASGPLWPRRFIVATGLSLILWVVNFYCVLSWLQPVLFGGNWIIEEVPATIGALTHLVFGWTMAVVYPLGKYFPYRPEAEQV